MTSIHTYRPGESGASLPALPPMSMACMAVGIVDLLDEAADLPQPLYISIHQESQSVGFQFAPVTASIRALTHWALRFGAVLVSHPDSGEGNRVTWYQASFSYYDIAVTAYARIPAKTGPAAATATT